MSRLGSPSGLRALSVGCAFTVAGCVSLPLPRAGSTLAIPVSERETLPECDSDWDGALVGAAIGLSPLVVSLFTSGPGDGVPLGFKLGFVGGIAGFWIGLAVDSRNCVEAS